ncbi:hypothetical protein ABZ504_51475 [Streptomyces mirabilis]|uniref:hypothetical protein n=1 Tax=Streptomyces mirabilis TaxID=68239 RepID=UPI0033EAB69C
MNVTRRPAASLATEDFDVETQELLDAIEVELPDFGGADLDLDVAFGTPIEMYETGFLPHERWEGLDAATAIQRLRAWHDRQLAAADILADDPEIAVRVRERLVDVLLPYAAQLRIAPLAAAPLPVAA